MRSRMAILIALVFALPYPAAATDDCAEFQQIMDARPSYFEGIRGAHDGDIDESTSLVRLPGASNCTIDGGNSPSLSCDWRYPKDGEDEVKAARAELEKSVERCLAPGLLKRIRSIPSTKPNWSDRTRFELTDGNSIAISHRLHVNKKHPERSTFILVIWISTI